MIIRSKEDLKQAYELLYFCGANDKFSYQIKKDIRDYNRRADSRKSAERSRRLMLVNYGIDGYTELLTVPAGVDPAEFFENDVRIIPRPSAYDCTGQLFTAWHKVTNWNGAPVIIHHVGVDI